MKLCSGLYYLQLAGIVNSYHFTRAELIADRLCVNLPEFYVSKIIKTEEEWEVGIGLVFNI